MYFHYYLIISPWKRTWPFIWRNLNPLYTRMLCAKIGWNWPSGSGKEDFFFISSMYFPYFVNISPWKKKWPFIWTNFNLLHPRMLCLVEIGMVVLEKMKMWKVSDNNNNDDDDGQQTNFDQKSSLEPSAQVS